jgi:hypothetical protein
VPDPAGVVVRTEVRHPGGQLVLAKLGIPVVRAMLFAGLSTPDWGIDARLVGVTLLTALVAGLLAGILPAIQASHPSLIA